MKRYSVLCLRCPISAYCLAVGRANVIANSTICDVCKSMSLWLARDEHMNGRGYYLRVFAPCVEFKELITSTTKALCRECLNCWEEKNNGGVRTADRYRALWATRDERCPKGRYANDLNNPSYQRALCLLQGSGNLLDPGN